MDISSIKFIDGKIIVNNKVYVLEPERKVAICHHIQSTKKFYFDPGEFDACENRFMVADTMHGSCVVFVEEIKLMPEHEILSKGAYMPLKKLLRVATPAEVDKEVNSPGLPF
jgi:hypothetical protein